MARIRFQSTELLAWLCAVVVTGLLYVSNSRYEQLHHRFATYRDTVRIGLQAEYEARDSALHEGDSLPAISIIDATGTRLTMAELPRLGVRYVYLFRDDCLACQRLAPVWDSLAAEVVDSVAFVTYHKASNVQPDARYHRAFGVQSAATPASYPLTKFVPALLVVRSDGLVSSIADGLPDVLKLLKMYGILPRTALDGISSSASLAAGQ